MNQHCYTAKEIADLAGMKTVNHLHSFIRQRCGMTPEEYSHTRPLSDAFPAQRSAWAG